MTSARCSSALGPACPPAATLAFGVVCALFYLGLLAVARPLPLRILFDGLVPLPPYRWVHPPANRAGDNRAPLPGAGVVVIGPPSRGAEIATDDDQALVTFPAGAVVPRQGETSVKVAVAPLDPAGLAPPPDGLRFDGNAYRIVATYGASGAPATLSGAATVVLRYPVHATALLRFADGAWSAVPPQVFTGSQQILGNTDRLGIFIAATSNR